jgi:hypothetical protein
MLCMDAATAADNGPEDLLMVTVSSTPSKKPKSFIWIEKAVKYKTVSL